VLSLGLPCCPSQTLKLNYNTGEQKWQRKKVKAKKAVSEARKNNFMD